VGKKGEGNGTRAEHPGVLGEPPTQLQSIVVRDLRLPSFHPEEPVLFLPEGRELVNTFADIVIAGIDPPIPYVAAARNGIFWYLGPVALLIAVGQSSRSLVARILPDGTDVETMEVIAAKATLLRPIHWYAEARAWQILNRPHVRETATGFLRHSSAKRRRITELLRAVQTIDILQISPPHLEHRAVSAVGPVIACLDPDFAGALLREAERHQWTVRQVLGLCQAWQAIACGHWEQRRAVGLPSLTDAERERLVAGGLDESHLPSVRGMLPGRLPYPVGAAGLGQLLEIASSAELLTSAG